MASKPVIGVTVDVSERGGRVRAECALAYLEMIERAGGVGVMLSPSVASVERVAALCDGFVLTGGDDPRMEGYGVATHPKATPMHVVRQRFEEALLGYLKEEAPDVPVLGVCLGMQMMALMAGGKLDQHMAETCDPEGRHWDGTHAVRLGDVSGVVFSRHRQCVVDPGALEVMGESDDGVIEAIADPSRRFYLGVQWHPERTEDERLGAGPFSDLLGAARRSAIASS